MLSAHLKIRIISPESTYLKYSVISHVVEAA